MKIKHKETGHTGFSGRFNPVGMSEIIVQWDDINGEHMGADSDYISEYEVYLNKTGEWKDMTQAFKDHDLITDDYNVKFFEPISEENRVRGYVLY